jgi:hypothetical protein
MEYERHKLDPTSKNHCLKQYLGLDMVGNNSTNSASLDVCNVKSMIKKAP